MDNTWLHHLSSMHDLLYIWWSLRAINIISDHYPTKHWKKWFGFGLTNWTGYVSPVGWQCLVFIVLVLVDKRIIALYKNLHTASRTPYWVMTQSTLPCSYSDQPWYRTIAIVAVKQVWQLLNNNIPRNSFYLLYVLMIFLFHHSIRP